MANWMPAVTAAWVPHGTWKDIFIGSYDYSYLFKLKVLHCCQRNVLSAGVLSLPCVAYFKSGSVQLAAVSLGLDKTS